KPTYWLVCGGSALSAFLSLGHGAFLVSFFLRNHPDEVSSVAASMGLQPLGFLGLAIGLLGGAAGAAGTLIGGALADRYGAKDPRAYMVAPAIGALVAMPLYVAGMTVDSVPLALIFVALSGMLTSLFI